MKKIEIEKEGPFRDTGFGKLLIHDSPYFKSLNFNFKAGQELPIHSHDIEGELAIAVLSGEGEFLSDGATLPARPGDVLVAAIAEPHGVRAKTDMRVIVFIAPPI